MKMYYAFVLFFVAITHSHTSPPDVCRSDSDGQLLMPDPEDCRFYYLCDHGKPLRRPCETGTTFNPETSFCDWTYNVKSCKRSNPSPPKVSCSSPYSDYLLLPDPEDRHFFYQCVQGKPFRWSCDHDSAFNPQTSMCESINKNITERTNPSLPNVTCSSDSDGKLVPDPDDSRFFYECVRGKLSRWSCDFGTVFNPETSECEMPAWVIHTMSNDLENGDEQEDEAGAVPLSVF